MGYYALIYKVTIKPSFQTALISHMPQVPTVYLLSTPLSLVFVSTAIRLMWTDRTISSQEKQTPKEMNMIEFLMSFFDL